MDDLPIDFDTCDEIHFKNSEVVTPSEFSIHKPFFSLSIHHDAESREIDFDIKYRSELPAPLPDDTNVRPGGRELRWKSIAVSAKGPNVDFHFSTISDMEDFFASIIDEAKKLAED